MLVVDVCLNAFKNALREINPCTSVQKSLSLHDSQLVVAGRAYELNRNVHLVAVGKAAPSMIEGAERVLGPHLVNGIASVPSGLSIPQNLKTKIFHGAENNLPDAVALENAQRIEQFISNAKGPDQLILFLISGGGSALLPAPIPGISLEEKVELIRLLQRSGADIKQLNTVRTTPSRLKGGGLARAGHPSKMISLITSDIVGDPLELISSGPTVILEKLPGDPLVILNQLGVADKVPQRIVELLKEAHSQRVKEISSRSTAAVDVHNVIIASNSILLNALASQLSSSSSLHPLIVTNKLEGDATEVGAKFAELIAQSLERGELAKELLVDGFIGGEVPLDFSQIESLNNSKRHAVVLLFGGETTVRFDGAKMSPDAKGGRNQELVLSAFHKLNLLMNGDDKKKSLMRKKGQTFALFSLGSDGQDGPTDACGAYFIDSDLLDCSNMDITHQLELSLNSKCSYQFWSEYKHGQNLVKCGKTGVNVMDVQMLMIDFACD